MYVINIDLYYNVLITYLGYSLNNEFIINLIKKDIKMTQKCIKMCILC